MASIDDRISIERRTCSSIVIVSEADSKSYSLLEGRQSGLKTRVSWVVQIQQTEAHSTGGFWAYKQEAMSMIIRWFLAKLNNHFYHFNGIEFFHF